MFPGRPGGLTLSWGILGVVPAMPLLSGFLLLQLVEFRGYDGLVVGVRRIVAVEVLVVRFGRVKCSERGDLGDDGGFEFGLRAFQRSPGDARLFVVFREDDGAVLRAGVGALAVEGGGVVGIPEEVDQLLVGDFFRVVGDLHDFGVAGSAAADLFVGGVFGGASGVAGDDGDHAGMAFVDGLDAPEASAAEGGCVGFHVWGGLKGIDEGEEGDEES